MNLSSEAEIRRKPFDELTADEPQVLKVLTSSRDNLKGQTQQFLDGSVRNPAYDHPALERMDFDEVQEKFDRAAQGVIELELPGSFRYEINTDFIESSQNSIDLLRAAQESDNATSPDEKKSASERFMQKNIEMYGEPQEEIYTSLLHEGLTKLKQKKVSPEAELIRNELFDLVEYDENAETTERFKPSDETVEWAHNVVTALFDNLLEHVPEDQETFNAHEIKAIFEEILGEEFEESVNDWKVNISSVSGITVRTRDKEVLVPGKFEKMSRSMLKQMVVHEIGTHVLRSIMGEETDMVPLQYGLKNYATFEEGLGVVSQQALLGAFEERGVGHYITAGLAYFENKDFRDVFEVKWRMGLLESLQDGEVPDDSQINDARVDAGTATRRIFRANEELPVFKDLSYFNGAANEVWKYLEEIRGDDLKLMFLYQGKTNLTHDAHKRVLYEARTDYHDEQN